MFFSWMVSSRAEARDFRSEMDWGVTGKLQPFSSDSSSSFTAHAEHGGADGRNARARTGTVAKASEPTLFGGENPRQRAAVGFHERFRVFSTLQGALKAAERQPEARRSSALKAPGKAASRAPEISSTKGNYLVFDYVCFE